MAFHKAKALQEAEKSVAQGKIAQAIRQYQVILDNEPSDLSLLNTIGDLFIRDRNITEGLRQFHRLAEAYVREGFNVKAIAIYRKITKVDPNSIETLMKLADLYQQQGLSREAREQYLQVADFFRKRNQMDKVLEVLHKLVQLDPENLNFRNRLAAELERIGRLVEAAAVYLESAEISMRREDQAGAEALLGKAAELDPKNSKAQFLRARLAVAHHKPEEAIGIINSTPELQGDPGCRRILLDAYITLRKIPEAANLVIDVFHANPSDLTPVSTVSWLLAEGGKIDEAYQLADTVWQSTIGANHSATLLDILHQIRGKAPNHVPTLELTRQICQRSGDDLGLLEILGALGRAYEQSGELEKAEAVYQKMVEREPDDDKFLNLLNGVRQKLGKEIKQPEFSTIPLPMAEEEDLPLEPQAVDADQETMVKEALENSDLFSRYNLTEKAIAELEKVLQIYPDQIDVHRRILEISRKGFPERGATAAAQLARIFRQRGDEDLAGKYEAIAEGSIQDIPPMPPPSAPPEMDVASPSATESPESTTPSEFPISIIQPEDSSQGSTPPPGEIKLDVSPWDVQASETVEVPALPSDSIEPPAELDLSEDLEALAKMIPEDPVVELADPESVTASELSGTEVDDFAIQEDALAAPLIEPTLAEIPQAEAPAGAAGDLEKKPTAGELEDGKVEVEFYLENDFLDEARQTIARLESKFPGDAFVADLRRKVEERSGKPAMPPAPSTQEVAPTTPSEEIGVSVPSEPDAAAYPTLIEPAQDTQPEAVAISPGSASDAAGESPAAEIPTFVPSEPDVLGDLVGGLDASLEGFAPAVTPSRAPVTSPLVNAVETTPSEVHAAAATPSHYLSPLSGLLAEMDEPLVLANNQDDPETHYNLGVAFREMGLLDESIGEFQKVVRGAGKGNYPSNFLQACSLLAICFMEKRMPALAVRWYKRALETPDLDEEALMALQYDLGVAFEQAGEARNALERFTEVYSQNIDFRDVAEKIRELQHKV
jgi:tetratricopeptide (TPR) repeat protein